MIRWTRYETLHFLIISSVLVILYTYLDFHWFKIPWTPLALGGTAVEFQKVKSQIPKRKGKEEKSQKVKFQIPTRKGKKRNFQKKGNGFQIDKLAQRHLVSLEFRIYFLLFGIY